MKYMIEIKSGNMVLVDDSTEQGRKQYLEMDKSSEYMEWFLYGC